MIAKPFPRSWLTGLDKIQNRAGYATCVIAGGAVLSMFTDHVPSDVDIFVLGPTRDAVADIWAYIGVEPPKMIASSGRAFNSAHAHWAHDGTLYDIVVMPEMTMVATLFDGFDLGISRAAFDGVNYILSPEFILDLHAKTITVFRTGTTEMTAARVSRFKRSLSWR